MPRRKKRKSLIDLIYKLSKLKQRKKDVISKEKELKKLQKDLKLKADKHKKELEKHNKKVKNEKEKIYNEILDKKIKKDKIIKIDTVILNPYENTQKLLGIIPVSMIPFLKKNKNYKTLIEYYDNTNTKQYIGVNKSYSDLLTLFKKESYVIEDETTQEKVFYKGKRVLSLKKGIPINIKFDTDKNRFFASADTLHDLINNVFDHRLTIPTKTTGNVFEWIKSNWIIIAILLVIFYLYQSGQIDKLI